MSDAQKLFSGSKGGFGDTTKPFSTTGSPYTLKDTSTPSVIVLGTYKQAVPNVVAPTFNITGQSKAAIEREVLRQLDDVLIKAMK